MLQVKTEYQLELLTPETENLLRSSNVKITKDKDGKTVPKLGPAKVPFHCHLINFY